MWNPVLYISGKNYFMPGKSVKIKPQFKKNKKSVKIQTVTRLEMVGNTFS